MKKFNSWKRAGWLMALLFAPRVVCAELASTVKIAFDNVAGVENNVMVFSGGNVGGYPTGSDGVPAGAFSAQTVKLSQSLLGAYVANPIDISGFYGVGEWLSPPAGTSADATHPPVISPTNVAVYSEGRVLAVGQGLLTIRWWSATAETNILYTYVIAQFASTSSVPVMVFHTESPAAGPKVDFSSIAGDTDVVVCPNDLIRTDDLWIDSMNRLHATGRVGLAVLLFKSKSTGHENIHLLLAQLIKQLRTQIPLAARIDPARLDEQINISAAGIGIRARTKHKHGGIWIEYRHRLFNSIHLLRL